MNWLALPSGIVVCGHAETGLAAGLRIFNSQACRMMCFDLALHKDVECPRFDEAVCRTLSEFGEQHCHQYVAPRSWSHKVSPESFEKGPDGRTDAWSHLSAG